MIKIFMTGDNHFGRKYGRYPDVREQLIQSRFDTLQNCVEEAERQQCDFFVVTGDLFDNISSISVKDVNRVVSILAGFNGRVIVLPGNHDYYTGEEKVWHDFTNAMNRVDHNITLVTEMRPLAFEVRGETVTFYPAFCQSKHSTENNLGWIKEEDLSGDDYHVGLSHGSIEGLTPDLKNQYFLMTERELLAIPMDVWLIGHTHIPYPEDLLEGRETEGYKIYNAGTHEQTDLSNNTRGWCFVITLKRKDGVVSVSAHRFASGRICYYDLAAKVSPEHGLRKTVQDAVSEANSNSVVRLTLTGTASAEDYRDRHVIYDELLSGCLTYEVVDTDLSEQITTAKIHAEFAEIGFAATLLESLMDDPKEVQMAYELLRACKE